MKKCLRCLDWMLFDLLNCAYSVWQIKTPAQLEAAFAFLAAIAGENLKANEFEDACGVGMIRQYMSLISVQIDYYYCFDTV